MRMCVLAWARVLVYKILAQYSIKVTTRSIGFCGLSNVFDLSLAKNAKLLYPL